MDLNFDELKSYEVQYLLVNLDYVVFEIFFSFSSILTWDFVMIRHDKNRL